MVSVSQAVVPLASRVCPLVGEVGPGFVQTSSWERLVPAHWWVELALTPVVGRAVSWGMFRGGCALRTTLGSCSADRWGCVPTCWLSGLRHSSAGGCRLLGETSLNAKMATSGRAHTNEYSLGPPLAMSLPPQ